ncbi:MAG: Crp/Fnr family transcriptional regulator [Bacteroidota bacterium]
MDGSGILRNIAKHVSLDQAEVDHFISLLTRREICRKEILQLEGKPCDMVHYVQAGTLRAFYRDRDGNEKTIMFAIQDWWITDMYAFIQQKPAVLNIDALEDSTVLQLQKADLDKLYLRVPKFERFFRIILQNAYIREQQRVVECLSMTAEERHRNFLKRYPQFAQRVPLKQIASYLGITPEFLSVLRKKK